VLPGNVFTQSSGSGSIRLGFPNEGKFGKVVSGALENSNVDVATELTSMIEAQRSYTANSKVFQTGSELMDILVNLKR
jgi:flagellar hook protein FlgE